MRLIAIVIFCLMLAPVAAVFYAMPCQLAGWSFVFAIVFTRALKAAILEPFAIAALMAVYFRTIETQTPNAEWDRKLTEASKHFRKLKAKAAAQFGPSSSSGPAGEPRPA